MSDGVQVPGLNRRIRASIYDHVFGHAGHEVGGVLVGRLGEGKLPEVTGSIAALEARGERASVTFTHDAWSSIHRELERRYAGQQIVGWYHSHPGFGIFLSGHDLFIQENFFSDPRQLAYVIDPHAGTEGVFGWRDGKIALLEECPTDRRATGARRRAAPRAIGRTSLGPLIALAAVAGLLGGIAAGLLVTGGDTTASRPATPARSTHGR